MCRLKSVPTQYCRGKPLYAYKTKSTSTNSQTKCFWSSFVFRHCCSNVYSHESKVHTCVGSMQTKISGHTKLQILEWGSMQVQAYIKWLWNKMLLNVLVVVISWFSSVQSCNKSASHWKQCGDSDEQPHSDVEFSRVMHISHFLHWLALKKEASEAVFVFWSWSL